jgi:hypothetical protein
VFVIRTDEQAMIARHAVELLHPRLPELPTTSVLAR